MGGGVVFSASPAIIGSKQYYVAKGSAPWYNDEHAYTYPWPDKSKVINVNTSLSGQATVICKDVTNMGSMLYDCKNLTSIDLSNFNTSNVTNMSTMFYGCYNLTSLDVSNFNTSKVTDMSYMFFNCGNLTILDLSNFNTSNVTNMSAMFRGCSKLTAIKGVIDMKSCTNYYSDMFKDCSKLTGVKIKNPPSDFESKAGLSSSQYTIVS